MKMKRFVLFLATCTALVGISCGSAWAGNILVNPGFESGSLSPWFNSTNFCGDCAWSVTSAEAHSGIYSAVVSGNRLLVQDFTPIPTSDVTDASVWLMMPDTGIAFIAFEYSNGTEGGDRFQVSSTWTQFNVTSFLTPGLDLEGFGVYGCSGCAGSSTTYADDFVLDTTAGSTVPEPGTLILFGTGLFSMVGFGWRKGSSFLRKRAVAADL